LRPAGILSLVVPDQRFCFDYFRFPTTTGEVLNAYVLQRARHSPGAVFDHVALAAERNVQIAWGRTSVGEVTLKHNIADAVFQYERAKSSNEYIDIHNWRFTPSSFRLILRELRALHLTPLVEKSFFETAGCEFYVSLGKPPATRHETSEILSDAERLRLIRDIRGELMFCAEGVDTQQYHNLSRMLCRRNLELQSANRRLDTIMASRSWRVTAPLRLLKDRLNRAILKWISRRPR
jgi:hypothetical protein